jgi:hypothetical protein
MSERIIGVNDVRFFVHQDMRLDRKNIIYKSEQFQKIIDIEKTKYELTNSFEFIMRINELFKINKNKLTDVKIDVIGYY